MNYVICTFKQIFSNCFACETCLVGLSECELDICLADVLVILNAFSPSRAGLRVLSASGLWEHILAKDRSIQGQRVASFCSCLHRHCNTSHHGRRM